MHVSITWSTLIKAVIHVGSRCHRPSLILRLDHMNFIVGGASVESRHIVTRGIVIIPRCQSKKHIAIRICLCTYLAQCWIIDCVLDTRVQWICPLDVLVSELYKRKIMLSLTPVVLNIIRGEMCQLMKDNGTFWYFRVQPRWSIFSRIRL